MLEGGSEVLGPSRRRMRRGAAVAGLTLALVAGMSAVTGSASASPVLDGVGASPVAEVAQERFDGATLLKGLFFGVGPAAARYPELVLARTNLNTERVAAVDRLVGDAEAREPGFLDRFVAGMYSGNHVEIQSAVQDAGRLLAGAAESSGGAANGTPLPDVPNATECVVISVFVAAELVIAAYIAAIGAAVVFFSDRDPVGQSTGGLTLERWVAKAAATL